jgi:hypothetical protein
VGACRSSPPPRSRGLLRRADCRLPEPQPWP